MNINTTWPIQNFTCPHCHAVSAFNCIFSARGSYKGSYYPVSLWSCHSCDRSIFINQGKSDEFNSSRRFNIESIYPTNEPNVDTRIPEGLAVDFIEATKNYNIGSYKSSAVMARRTIQKMCLNLGATKKKKLYEQIDELKLNGKLHSDLADIATEIRFLGNDGAHPEDDGLDEIKIDDAKEILDFTLELLDDLYVRPQKVAEMKNRRESKTATN